MAITFNRDGKILCVDSLHIVSDYSNPGFANPGLVQAQLEEIGQWCIENHCGKRISYDKFKFRNEKDMQAFLLRWS